jgi:hypothetical protein
MAVTASQAAVEVLHQHQGQEQTLVETVAQV